MSVGKLASRALIFVGLKLKIRFLKSHFLVELVLVPPLSRSQPYMLLEKIIYTPLATGGLVLIGANPVFFLVQ